MRSAPPPASTLAIILRAIALAAALVLVAACAEPPAHPTYKPEGGTGAMNHMRAEDVRCALALPWGTIGSDGSALTPEGILAGAHPHPRSYGSFTRVVGYYVREQRLMPHEEAERKMTSLAAAQPGLADRATVAPGFRPT